MSLGGDCTLEKTSEKIGISVRTIQRQLSVEETTYSDILKAVRIKLAEELLKNPDGSVSQIAQQLGYAGKQQFIRAYRGWHGTTPRGHFFTK